MSIPSKLEHPFDNIIVVQSYTQEKNLVVNSYTSLRSINEITCIHDEHAVALRSVYVPGHR